MSFNYYFYDIIYITHGDIIVELLVGLCIKFKQGTETAGLQLTIQ